MNAVSRAVLVKKMLVGGVVERPPYIPLVRDLACKMGQISKAEFDSDAARQARALVEIYDAIGGDVLVAGGGGAGRVAAEALRRLKPHAAGRAVGVWLGAGDVGGARDCLEAGVEVLFVSDEDDAEEKARIIGNLGRFYATPVLLVAPGSLNGPVRAQSLGLQGAISANVDAASPGVIGGSLAPNSIDKMREPPRTGRFFWSFDGQVPDELEPARLVALGRRLGDLSEVA